MITATTVRTLPNVETPDILDLDGLFLVTGPEEDGSVGADFDYGHLFVKMSPADARQVAAAFLRAAAAVERA